MGACPNAETIPASPDTVWKALRDFHDLTAVGAVATSCEKVGDVPGDQVGAKRIVNDVFHETVIAHDDSARTLQYSIDEGPGPLAKGSGVKYVGTIKVLPGSDAKSTRLEWGSEFQGGDEKAVFETCDPVYKALLAGVKEHFSS